MYKFLKISITSIVVLLIGIFLITNFIMCKTTTEPIYVKGNPDIKFIKSVKNCGATSGFNTKVYMLKKSDNVNLFTSAIIELNTKNPVIECKDSHTIKIKVKDTDIYQFKSFYYIAKDKYTIVLEY